MKSVVILADKDTYTDVRGESANYATARTTASSLTPNRELPIFGQSEAGGDYTDLMEMEKKLQSVKMEISKVLGIDILK